MSEFFDDSRPEPFPASGLEELAAYFRQAKAGAKTEYGRDLYEQRVKTCTDAGKTHAAVRERMLLAETDNKRLLDIIARARAMIADTDVTTRSAAAVLRAAMLSILDGNAQPTGATE